MSESDQDERDRQMNFLASQAQKERWEEYADEAGFRSMSEFFRVAAEKEVSGDSDGRGESTGDSTQALSEITETLQRVEKSIHDLDNRLGVIESEVREDPEIKQLANEVFGALPTRGQLVEYEKQVRQAGAVPDPRTPTSYTGRVEHIASHLDEKEHRIEQALEKLQQDMNQVHTMILAEEIEGWSENYENGDETRYYKEE